MAALAELALPVIAVGNVWEESGFSELLLSDCLTSCFRPGVFFMSTSLCLHTGQCVVCRPCSAYRSCRVTDQHTFETIEAVVASDDFASLKGTVDRVREVALKTDQTTIVGVFLDENGIQHATLSRFGGALRTMLADRSSIPLRIYTHHGPRLPLEWSAAPVHVLIPIVKHCRIDSCPVTNSVVITIREA